MQRPLVTQRKHRGRADVRGVERNTRTTESEIVADYTMVIVMVVGAWMVDALEVLVIFLEVTIYYRVAIACVGIAIDVRVERLDQGHVPRVPFFAFFELGQRGCHRV